MSRKNKHSADDWDDGRTVAPMSAGWMPWNAGNHPPKKEKKKETSRGSADPGLTKGERRSLICGMFRAYLPAFLCIAASFLLLWFVARLWLG